MMAPGSGTKPSMPHTPQSLGKKQLAFLEYVFVFIPMCLCRVLLNHIVMNAFLAQV